MAQHLNYTKPRKFNFVSFLFILIAAALVYGVIQYGPPYYRKWKAGTVVTEAANKVFPKRHGDGDVEFFDLTKKEVESQLRELGVQDPGLRIFIEHNANEVTVRAEYIERIKHPFISKISEISFSPFANVKANAL